MNPLTNVKNTQELNKKELELGLIGKKSWHDKYKDSAWVFLGGLPYDLTEGDVICVFSQYGEIVNLNLVRDKQTGKFKGFGFLCYQDQRSTVLAVDNLNGFSLLNRTIRVDHVEGYRQPKEHGDEDEVTQKLRAEGCAPKLSEDEEEEEEEDDLVLSVKKEKKEKHKKSKKKKEKKEKKRKKEKSTKAVSSDSSEDSADNDKRHIKVKTEKVDRGYDKALANSSWRRDQSDGAPPSGHKTNNDTRESRFNDRGKMGDRGPRERERQGSSERGRGDREMDVGRQRTNRDDQFTRNRDRSSDRGRVQGRDNLARERGRDRYDREDDREGDRDRSGDRERGRGDGRRRDRSDDRQVDNRKQFYEDEERHRSKERYRNSGDDYRKPRNR